MRRSSRARKFLRWREDRDDDAYHHPFALPHGYFDTNLVAGWLAHGDVPFGMLTCFQPHLCEAGKAPKQFATPEWAAVANYAYHLDAAKLGVFLRRHCVERLGVRHVSDHMTGVEVHDNGDIAALQTRENGAIAGDLFVDCSGMRALLIGQHYGVEVESQMDVLFNDRAIAIQVPYADPGVEIACQTLSTAQEAGWIWDIGLQARRGIGHVYSSAHTSDDDAEAALRRYIVASGGREQDIGAASRISFRSGFRRAPWHRNCVAIGLASGFVEPLEASSLVMVELAAGMLADQMPATRETMDIVARRFNDTFSYRWDRIVDFLKLHYVLSKRDDSDYWRDNRRAGNRSRRACRSCWNCGATSRRRATTSTASRKCFRRPATSSSSTAWASCRSRARPRATATTWHAPKAVSANPPNSPARCSRRCQGIARCSTM